MASEEQPLGGRGGGKGGGSSTDMAVEGQPGGDQGAMRRSSDLHLVNVLHDVYLLPNQ